MKAILLNYGKRFHLLLLNFITFFEIYFKTFCKKKGDIFMQERINNAQNKLTTTDFNVLNYLMTNKQKIQNQSIHEITEKTFTSSASIVRLAKKLGFSGFSEMKYYIKSELEDNSEQFKSSISLLEQDIKDTLNLISEQNLQPICKQIQNTNQIYCYGTDWGEKNATSYLTRNFLACNIFMYQFPSVTEFLWTLDQIKENDLIIILSFSGNNEDLQRLIPLLKVKNVPILSITPLSGNFLSSEATYRLYYKATHLDINKTELTEYNFYSSLNILIDFLFRYYHENYFLE